MNSSTLNIAIEVDDKGSVKLRELGKTAKGAGEKGEKSFKGLRGMITKLKGDTDLSISSFVKMGGIAFTATLAGVTALAAGVVSLITSSAAEAREMENLSRLAQMNSVDFQNAAFATRGFGIDQGQLADISKDTLEKLGEFTATGGGGFKDFFDNIGDKIGLTAEALQGLSGPDVLIAVTSAMEDANLSYEQQSFYLESIASDTTLLIPLLKDHGAALKGQTDRADELGIAISGVETKRLLEAQRATNELTTAMGSLKTHVAASLAPAFTDVVGKIMDGMTESAGGVKGLATTISTYLMGAIDGIVTGLEYVVLGWHGMKLAGNAVMSAIVGGIASMIDFFDSGWRDIAFVANDVWLDIKFAALLAFDGITEGFANVLESIAAQADALSLTIKNPFGDDFEMGMSGAAESIRGVAKTLRDASTATEDYAAEKKKLNAEYQLEVKAGSALAKELHLISGFYDEAGQAAYDSMVKTTDAADKVHLAIDGIVTGLEAVEISSTQAAETQKSNLEGVAAKALETTGTVGTYFADLNESIVGADGSSTKTFASLSTHFGELEEQGGYSLLTGAGSIKSSFTTLDTKVQDVSTAMFGAVTIDVEDFTKVTEKELITNASEWEKFTGSATDTFGSFKDALVNGDFANIGEAWNSLWTGMLSTVVDTVAKIGATFVVDTVVSSFFHEGTMGLKHDEYNAVYQEGEIVIPRNESKHIRENLGNGASFEGIVGATEKYGATVSAADPFGPSAIGQLGATTGGVAGYAAVAMSPLGSVPGAKKAGFEIGSAVVGYGAEKMADAANVRDHEGLRDAKAAGYLGTTDAHAFHREDARMGLDKSTTANDIAAAINAGVAGVKSATRAIGTHAMDTANDAIRAFTSAKEEEARTVKGYGSHADDTGLGLGQEGLGLEGGGPDADGGGHGARGGGNEGTSEPGGIGGYATGGIVNGLMVPQGEDGFAALQFGEGVISRKGMATLDKINDGNLSDSGTGLNTAEVGAILWQIATATKKAAKILERFEYTVIPLITREAIA